MSEPKTPLELSNHIKDRSAKLFEVRRIAKALGDIADPSALADALKARSLRLVAEATGAEVLP